MALTGGQVVAIMFGGSLGALMRYLISTTVNEMISGKLGVNFPFGTLVVNILGSFAMGFLAMWLVENFDLNPLLRLAIFVGFLGAFTTFSTFSMDTLNLFESGLPFRALLNMVINVSFTVIAVWLGVLLGKHT